MAHPFCLFACEVVFLVEEETVADFQQLEGQPTDRERHHDDKHHEHDSSLQMRECGMLWGRRRIKIIYKSSKYYTVPCCSAFKMLSLG